MTDQGQVRINNGLVTNRTLLPVAWGGVFVFGGEKGYLWAVMFC